MNRQELAEHVQEQQELTRLLWALQDVLARKAKRLGGYSTWGDRGMPVTQLVTGSGGPRLHIYEAGYQGTIFPRYAYRLPCAYRHHSGAVAWALTQERKRVNKDKILALVDRRMSEEVEHCWLEEQLAPFAPKDERPPEVNIRLWERVRARAKHDIERADEVISRLTAELSSAAPT